MGPKEINSIFSDFIKQMMESKNINQSELARQTRVSRERINRIVNNLSRISLHDFVIIAMALDVDIVKDLLKKVGKDIPIMSTSTQKNLHHFVFKAQQMHCPIDDESLSHTLCQAPSFPEAWTALITASFRRVAQRVSDLRQSVGVWQPSTVARHFITNCRNLPMQRELVEGCCLEGSY